MTLSTPVKIIALAGLALALGAGALLLLAGHSGTTKPAVVTPAHASFKVVQITAKPKPAHPKALVLDQNLPAPLYAALEQSREVVAFVYSPVSTIDRLLLPEIRGGAHDAHVGFVALNVQQEPIAASVYSWAASTADPAVLVVHRPGKIVLTIEGPTDRDSVAQAAAAER